ncbi:Uncharacterised protein [Vibrio cholerae]|nr:Uncharacterised protein [Vibrio cholerae]
MPTNIVFKRDHLLLNRTANLLCNIDTTSSVGFRTDH